MLYPLSPSRVAVLGCRKRLSGVEAGLGRSGVICTAHAAPPPFPSSVVAVNPAIQKGMDHGLHRPPVRPPACCCIALRRPTSNAESLQARGQHDVMGMTPGCKHRNTLLLSMLQYIVTYLAWHGIECLPASSCCVRWVRMPVDAWVETAAANKSAGPGGRRPSRPCCRQL